MPTMNDVAKKAGVSRGTVSNVINGQNVRPELKKKVEEAIKELGYIPNANARSLKSNKTQTVVVILPTLWNPFFSKLATEIEKELHQNGYKLLLCLSDNDEQREIDYVEMAKQNKADGILSITYSNIWPALKDSNIPLVTMERYFSDGIPFISTDNYLGAEMAAAQLQELGCHKLLYVGRQTSNNQIGRIRKEGFEDYCRRERIPYEIYFPKASSSEFPGLLKKEIIKILKQDPSIDGIFCNVDRYAFYVIEALEQSDLNRMPAKDLQIIGFDGVSTGPNESLIVSSIAQPVDEIARKAVDVLIRLIQDEPVYIYQLLEPVFKQGKTTRH